MIIIEELLLESFLFIENSLEQIMKVTDLQKFLQYSDFYNLLSKQCDDKSCNILLEKLIAIELKPNEILYKEGEPSDSLYILAEGLLGSEIIIDGKQKTLSVIRSGQTVGELGVIASQPRTSTITALRHSYLLKLTKEEFDQYFITQPKVLLSLLNILVTRSISMLKSVENVCPYITVAFIAANESVAMDTFFDKMISILEKHTKIKCFKTEDYQTVDDSLIRLTEEAERNASLVIYKINFTQEKIAEFFLSRSERVFVVADGLQPPHMHKSVHKLNSKFVKRDLVLLYPRKIHLNEENMWLKTIDFFRYHHVAINEDEDCTRLVRFIVGKAVGLVLSGGGTKGWLHAGAMQALMEANIPIDVVGGTSVGGVIGAKFLLEDNFQVFLDDMQKYAKTNAHPYRITNLTFPLVSILNGSKLSKATKMLFGNKYIENLWRPFFCVLCDLTQSLEVVRKQGKMALWARASTSIPGIVPPVTIDGKIYVDGAVINNLPTDIMKEYLEGMGVIVAVDLSFSQDTNYYNFPPVINFLDALLIRLKVKYKNYKFPRIFDLLMRARIVGTSEKLQKNCTKADILIRPNLAKYNLLTETKHTDELFNLGYNLMKEKIPDLKKLIDKTNNGKCHGDKHST